MVGADARTSPADAESTPVARPRDPHPYRVSVIRYAGADGKRCRADDPGAVRVATETETYYADLYPGGRRTRISLQTSDLSAAWKRLHEEQRLLADREAGVYELLKSGALKRFRPRNIYGPRQDMRVTRITEETLSEFIRDNERYQRGGRELVAAAK